MSARVKPMQTIYFRRLWHINSSSSVVPVCGRELLLMGGYSWVGSGEKCETFRSYTQLCLKLLWNIIYQNIFQKSLKKKSLKSPSNLIKKKKKDFP